MTLSRVYFLSMYHIETTAGYGIWLQDCGSFVPAGHGPVSKLLMRGLLRLGATKLFWSFDRSSHGLRTPRAGDPMFPMILSTQPWAP